MHCPSSELIFCPFLLIFIFAKRIKITISEWQITAAGINHRCPNQKHVISCLKKSWPSRVYTWIMTHNVLLYSPLRQKCMCVYWSHSVCLAVFGQNGVSYVCSTILTGFISYLHIPWNNFRRCVACGVLYLQFKIGTFNTFLTCFDFGSNMNQ